MRIEIRCPSRGHLQWIKVDPRHPPPVVPAASGEHGEHEQYLDWSGAFDDEGHLRRCPICGCDQLFRKKTIPALNGFVVVLAVGLVCLALYGLSGAPWEWVVAALVAVAVVNFGIILFSPPFLGCYDCGSGFHQVPVAQGQQEWDGQVARSHQRARAETDASIQTERPGEVA